MSFANWMAGDRSLDFYIGTSISSSGLLSLNNQTTTYYFKWAPNQPFRSLNINNTVVAPKTLGEALQNAFLSKKNSVIKDISFVSNQ